MKRLSSLFLTAAIGLSAMAVAPKPGLVTVSQPDGTAFEARIMGDAAFHWYETPTGQLMAADFTDGFFRPVTPERLQTLREEAQARVLADEARTAALRHQRIAPIPIKRDFPTTGTVRGLIVMAEFQDVKFQEGSTREYYDTMVNTPGYSGPETFGSVNDFFREQSKGLFAPEFDIVGPITLPKNRADYGYYEDLDGLFRDAANAAIQTGVDFSRYDVDDDFFVDFFFVIFAGHGEAQGGPAECVWPAMKDITDYVFDSFGGMYLGVAACSCELKGGSGSEMDGVATICHEFSHILGLPDVYDPQGTGGYGMGHFDMMCYGPYNDNGRTPCNYTAMEKYTLGWIEPAILDSPQTGLTLRNFGETDECFFIVNPENRNEYYTLENRQLTGFDHALPGHGLIISYCHYDKSIWAKNSPNSPVVAKYEHISIIPADNTRVMNEASEAADPWPGTSGNTAFTDTSYPEAKWQSSGKPVGMPITNIKENEDGTITFDFMADNAVGITEADAHGEDEYYNLQGIRVAPGNILPGIYIRRSADGKHTKRVLIN